MPAIAVIPALLAGGTLVPHAAGGLIVTGSSGYVVGTYVSATTINILIGGSAATVVGGTVGGGIKLGLLPKLFSPAGQGTAVGAGTVVTVATPFWIPFVCVAALGSVIFLGYGIAEAERNSRRKEISDLIKTTPEGEETQFTEEQAEFIQKFINEYFMEGLLNVMDSTLTEEDKLRTEEVIFFNEVFEEYRKMIALTQSQGTVESSKDQFKNSTQINPIFGRQVLTESPPMSKFPKDKVELIKKFMDKYIELITSSLPEEEVQVDEEMVEYTKELYEFIRTSIYGPKRVTSEGHTIDPSKNPVF